MKCEISNCCINTKELHRIHIGLDKLFKTEFFIKPNSLGNKKVKGKIIKITFYSKDGK